MKYERVENMVWGLALAAAVFLMSWVIAHMGSVVTRWDP